MSQPDKTFFKPVGVMMRELEIINLTLDELEAIRLADLDGLYQEDAAIKMNISRQTFGNIVNSAHKKIADFLINSKSLSINGGNIEMAQKDTRNFICYECKHTWAIPFGEARPARCPQCNSTNIHRSPDERGNGRGRRGRQGNCRNK